MQTKGFTLLELVIVIGILAVLGAVSVLVLNPGQLFAEARDSTRVTDLQSVTNAIGLYLSSVSSPNMQAGTGFTCGTNWGTSRVGGTPTKHVAATTAAHAGVFAVDGSGWVAVPLSTITGGSPLGALPKDPTNDDTYNYQYSCDNTAKTFELDAKMESTKYSNGGTKDKESTDGGNDANEYEVGTSLVL